MWRYNSWTNYDYRPWTHYQEMWHWHSDCVQQKLTWAVSFSESCQCIDWSSCSSLPSSCEIYFNLHQPYQLFIYAQSKKLFNLFEKNNVRYLQTSSYKCSYHGSFSWRNAMPLPFIQYVQETHFNKSRKSLTVEEMQNSEHFI